MHVLVVWEPILPTDWRPPSGSTLARISDIRAQQFWDPQHDVAKSLSRIEQPDSGEKFHWDEAILYAPHSRWESEPTPLFWQGPVYRAIHGLDAAIGKAARRTP
ncbi:MAG TPA: hypothetical protein VJ731_06180 [Terriglobales bacterium]|nr:hypothetical protein [Terriglobales bacterium]